MGSDVMESYKPIDLNFGDYWGTRSINHPDDLGAIVQQETEGWKWFLEKTASATPHAAAFRSALQASLKKLRHAYNEVENFRKTPEAKDASRLQEVWSNAAMAFAAYFARKDARYLPAKSEPALRMQALAIDDMEVACAFGLFACRLPPPTLDGNYVAGATEARLFARGFPSPDEIQPGIVEIKSVAQRQVAALVGDLRRMTMAVHEATAAVLVRGRTIQESVEETMRKSEQIVFDSLAKLTENVDATRAAFLKDMQLQASVTYWTERARACRWAWATSLFAIAALGSAAAGLAYWRFYTFADDGFTVRDAFELAFFALCIGFLLWGVGQASKIFMMNIQGVADASQRVTMVKTYLALVAENKGPPESDRTLLLIPLFRMSRGKEDFNEEEYGKFVKESLKLATRVGSGT